MRKSAPHWNFYVCVGNLAFMFLHTTEKIHCIAHIIPDSRYNATTGIFTVPPGGAGYYYFVARLQVHQGEWANFDLRINEAWMGRAEGDQEHNGAGDSAHTTVSVAAPLQESKFSHKKLILV